ncbi:hypothetical protein I7I53_10367 [Histoplasma capsulatum var. duboisii H88]|uniref:Uncharacterized protein n=1 Tax=Ajellomyces capsulatus (strain H88) TaxID=544711 RepID=A0A8A1LAN5_AJEC8|nr:hypothetical protein I7I53_10367 [Histoplasma capsulatum var. duboisii H88]
MHQRAADLDPRKRTGEKRLGAPWRCPLRVIRWSIFLLISAQQQLYSLSIFICDWQGMKPPKRRQNNSFTYLKLGRLLLFSIGLHAQAVSEQQN